MRNLLPCDQSWQLPFVVFWSRVESGGGLNNPLQAMSWDSAERVLISYHRFDETGTGQCPNQPCCVYTRSAMRSDVKKSPPSICISNT